jgi:hypothetical protein
MSDDFSWSQTTQKKFLGQGVDSLAAAIKSQLADEAASRGSALRKLQRITNDIDRRQQELKQQRREHKANQRRLNKDRRASGEPERAKEEGQRHQHLRHQQSTKEPLFQDHEVSLVSDSSRARGGRELPPGWVLPNKGFSFTLFPPRSDTGTTTLRVPLSLGQDSGSDTEKDESVKEKVRREKGRKEAPPSPPPLGVTLWGKPRPRYRPGSRQVKHRLPPILSPEFRRY